jgi:hypothetical protein
MRDVAIMSLIFYDTGSYYDWCECAIMSLDDVFHKHAIYFMKKCLQGHLDGVTWV